MIDIQNSKSVVFVEPVSLTTPWGATSLVVDKLGWDYLTLTFDVGTHATKVAACSVRHSTASGSGQVAISGTVGTADADWTIPAANTSPYHVLMHINLMHLNRYIDVLFTGAADGVVSVTGFLSRGNPAVTSTATSGADVFVVVA